jgi:hypothetical protein
VWVCACWYHVRRVCICTPANWRADVGGMLPCVHIRCPCAFWRGVHMFVYVSCVYTCKYHMCTYLVCSFAGMYVLCVYTSKSHTCIYPCSSGISATPHHNLGSMHAFAAHHSATLSLSLSLSHTHTSAQAHNHQNNHRKIILKLSEPLRWPTTTWWMCPTL